MAIVSAEGEKLSAILAAEGQAEARMKVAEAEARAVTLVRESLTTSGDPANYLIALKYLESLRDITANANKLVVLPYEATSTLGSLAGIREILSSNKD